ncbi:hypothetical protein SCB49_01642 [unidentified eubacterium SCB49]|nr:hypothetical protein SCB49_01642 [unidentified eubacterium SCB49]
MNKGIKIVIFDGSLNPTTFINRLAMGLSQQHNVLIVGFGSSKFKKLEGIQYVSLGNNRSLVSMTLKSLTIALGLLFKKGDVKAVFSVFRWSVSRDIFALKKFNFNTKIADIAPAILHVQWPSLLPLIASQLKNKQVKVIVSQRGYQINVRPFVNSENKTYLQKMYPQIDGFHSVSKAISEKGDLIYNQTSKIDHVVYSGFNMDALPFQESYNPTQPLKIITVGRPHWIKGNQYALKALQLLKQKGIDFIYEIVGVTTNEELLYLIHAYGLTEQVILTSRVTQDIVYKKMKEASLFLLSSLEEGLPNVLVEAMALGVPVISTDCGGVKELVEEGTGIVVPKRDAAAMAAAIIAFSEMPTAVINKQRKAARHKVAQQHTAKKMITGMESLYAECLNA